MNKCAHIYVNYPNIVVLNVYLDVIKAALERLGYNCQYIKTMESIPKKDLVVFPMAKDAFKYYLKGYHNVILWQQGATAAESYMRHQSKLRAAILNFMDCFAMKKAKMVFYVSEYMKDYYEKMAHTSFTKKAYVMPCFNESLEDGVFEKKDYSKKIFTYVGSLDLWQCFEETAELYSKIEKAIPDALFKVLTFKTEEAERIIKEKGIKNYSVNCVPKDKVKEELEEASFGFILRHDIEVNRVATPTKLSSYLSAGVLPVYSSCLRDFQKQAEGKSFAFAMNPDGNADELVEYVSKPFDVAVIQKEIEELFSTYYSVEGHISKIESLAKVCLQ